MAENQNYPSSSDEGLAHRISEDPAERIVGRMQKPIYGLI
jgi:hypothetical protein